jgi:hypothetical protein
MKAVWYIIGLKSDTKPLVMTIIDIMNANFYPKSMDLSATLIITISTDE